MSFLCKTNLLSSWRMFKAKKVIIMAPVRPIKEASEILPRHFCERFVWEAFMQNSLVVFGHEIWVFVATMLRKKSRRRSSNWPQKWVSHYILTGALNAGWRWIGNNIAESSIALSFALLPFAHILTRPVNLSVMQNFNSTSKPIQSALVCLYGILRQAAKALICISHRESFEPKVDSQNAVEMCSVL